MALQSSKVSGSLLQSSLDSFVHTDGTKTHIPVAYLGSGPMISKRQMAFLHRNGSAQAEMRALHAARPEIMAADAAIVTTDGMRADCSKVNQADIAFDHSCAVRRAPTHAFRDSRLGRRVDIGSQRNMLTASSQRTLRPKEHNAALYGRVLEAFWKSRKGRKSEAVCRDLCHWRPFSHALMHAARAMARHWRSPRVGFGAMSI